ncbi:LysR family transcriptional regulator [Motilimonas cestriensis]|uniref:LysR family transcriptional regulator n=1 Tax=Motilimonas cestriensis TaxID=2742685 RepID=A0ABS8WAN4_9GAMM|nr:LysR family transcriptional regulator [Motilimonas cestriensis]MCE2595352.1 LysR family transcriptional regulator [Motilimonas cestriensis]
MQDPTSKRLKATLEQWRILQAVVDHGGYSKAAEALNKSQSSLNHAVTKLQHQMGVALLEVKGRKAYLTNAGEVMLRRSRLLTQSAFELEQLADNLCQGWEPEITLYAEIIYPRERLYRALQAFLPQSRGSRIKLLDSVITGTSDAIIKKQADIVITGQLPKGYLGQPLINVHLVPCISPLHPLSQQSTVDVKELMQELQVVIKDTAITPNESLGWLKSEQRLTVSNFHEAVSLVSQGIGFAWFPKHFVASQLKQKQLQMLPLKQGKSRTSMTHLVVPDETRIGPGASTFVNCLLAEHNLESDAFYDSNKEPIA